MAEFEEKLNSILSNPDLMGQIMSMAGAMNQPAVVKIISQMHDGIGLHRLNAPAHKGCSAVGIR